MVNPPNVSFILALVVLAEARLLEGSNREALDLVEQGQALLADLESAQPLVKIARRRLLGTQAKICLLTADYLCAERSALAALAMSSSDVATTLRNRLLLQRSLALAQFAQPGKQAEGQKLLDDVRAAARSKDGECSEIALAAKYDPPITLADLASPPPTSHCR